MKWTDTFEIAIELFDQHPDVDPLTINFVNLTNMVMQLTNFVDSKDNVGEKILEAIQMQWIEEKE